MIANNTKRSALRRTGLGGSGALDYRVVLPNIGQAGGAAVGQGRCLGGY